VSILPEDFTLLQVTPELETGGAEQTTIDVAHGVIAQGGKALVATKGGRMAARLEADGGRLAQMPAQSKNPLIMLGNAARMIDLIRREKVTLVHARSRAPAFSALWAAHATKVPFVATYHGVYNAKSNLKRWYNAVMTKGDLVIANSEYTRAHVIAEHGIPAERVVAIPRGVDLTRFEPGLVSAERVKALRDAWGVQAEDRRLKVLLAGRLTRWKGQALVIEAMARLKAISDTRILLLLVGDDQGRKAYRAELEHMIAQAGLVDSIRLVGHCDDMPRPTSWRTWPSPRLWSQRPSAVRRSSRR
jgi:glycosyltransferase involved in cell wall biosynthesis